MQVKMLKLQIHLISGGSILSTAALIAANHNFRLTYIIIVATSHMSQNLKVYPGRTYQFHQCSNQQEILIYKRATFVGITESRVKTSPYTFFCCHSALLYFFFRFSSISIITYPSKAFGHTFRFSHNFALTGTKIGQHMRGNHRMFHIV